MSMFIFIYKREGVDMSMMLMCYAIEKKKKRRLSDAPPHNT
tara:strand:+ start:253 stop:375 length:123 start_codon:yes stop_codon:yes gene_type:complete